VAVADREDALLTEQMRYYDDRTDEYDDCYFRRGQHDLGPEFNSRWFEETGRIEAAVRELPLSARVLELACGTGLWTRLLAPRAERLVAVDASAKMIARNRARVGDPRVEYVQADLFDWVPSGHERFDLIFMGFFLSHVPPDRFDSMWSRIGSWLAPGGSVFLCDDCAGPDRPLSGRPIAEGPSFAHRRRLGNGNEYVIVKLFYEPEELQSKLEALGWDAQIQGSGEHFLYGRATVAAPPSAGERVPSSARS
jgi:SAM-dependent methyltransferase